MSKLHEAAECCDTEEVRKENNNEKVPVRKRPVGI